MGSRVEEGWRGSIVNNSFSFLTSGPVQSAFRLIAILVAETCLLPDQYPGMVIDISVALILSLEKNYQTGSCERLFQLPSPAQKPNLPGTYLLYDLFSVSQVSFSNC